MITPLDAFNANFPASLPETMVQLLKPSPSASVAAIAPLLPETAVPLLAFSAIVNV